MHYASISGSSLYNKLFNNIPIYSPYIVPRDLPSEYKLLKKL